MLSPYLPAVGVGSTVDEAISQDSDGRKGKKFENHYPLYYYRIFWRKKIVFEFFFWVTEWLSDRVTKLPSDWVNE